jgi:beta-carotene hydroxylase
MTARVKSDPRTGFYAAHALELKRELASMLDRDQLRELHRRQPWRHFAVLARQLVLLAASIIGIAYFRNGWWWIPFAIVEGWTIFNFTILLHEVLHGLVFARPIPFATRLLELCYAIPSGISPSQFTRWHLDHHAELGSDESDPKRHHLTPKINKRWFKALYFTPALFPIYFRAAARETSTYPEWLQKRIARERKVSAAFHLGVMALLWLFSGTALVVRAYLVPVFLVFPVAFALNRLGQHYDIRPEDPAQWSTLMKPSWFWDFAYLWSNYHLEHHYYPGVPFYNLPKLRRVLEPYFRAKGMGSHGYGQLIYHYLVLNKRPHSNWHPAAEA